MSQIGKPDSLIRGAAVFVAAAAGVVAVVVGTDLAIFACVFIVTINAFIAANYVEEAA